MRRLLWGTAWGLCLVALGGTGLARASELNGGVAKPGKVVLPVTPSITEVATPATKCGKHGTSLEFVATPSEAATQAKKEGKLVFVLHVSGHFEDPRFT